MNQLTVPLGEVHVYLSHYDEVNDEELLARYRELLDEAERAQEKRFYFAVDQRRYLVTRALVRTTLSRYCAVPPQAWAFVKNDYGCPRVANPQGVDAKLCFNLSHTKHLIALAVATDCRLGIDVENARDRDASLQIADRFFSAEEADALCALPVGAQPQRFFEYWTLKESYIKARGMGLSIPLDQFTFRIGKLDSVELARDPGLNDGVDWRFWHYRLGPYLIALCAESGFRDERRLTFKRSMPLLPDTEVFPELLRSSKPSRSVQPN